jgi:hypothetical protein
MNRHIVYLGFSLVGLLLSPIGYADEVTDDTVTVVDEGNTPADVANLISLPDAASDSGREHSQLGLGVANQARDLGREFGQQMSEQARDAHANAAGGNAGSHPGRP